MNKSAVSKSLAILLSGAGLVSCATVPAPLQGQFSAATPHDAAAAGASQAVRWGGEIIKVEPKKDATCFEILARQLDASARPLSSDPSDGRFKACRAGFYDPEVFARGRELTVTGTVTGTDSGKVGEFDYSYPHVAADTIYLWPKRPMYARTPYYDPWMYGYGGPWGFGPYWGPFWGGPTYIIRDHPHTPPSHPAH
jgi:outer membrane lipoprotein